MARIVQPKGAARYHNIQELEVNGLWVGKERECEIWVDSEAFFLHLAG